MECDASDYMGLPGEATRRYGCARTLDNREVGRCGVSKMTKAPNQGKAWTPKDDALLVHVFKNTGDINECVKVLGRSLCGVATRLEKHGLLINRFGMLYVPYGKIIRTGDDHRFIKE